jgi:hypothetical protein
MEPCCNGDETLFCAENRWKGPLKMANRMAVLASGNWHRVLIISAVLLVPCFWHKPLLAGDLGSHVYNAWLAQLTTRGQAPGLWISAQWTNILFDWILSGLASVLPIRSAGKLAASLTVLLFFWGTFSFVSVASKRLAWTMTPLLAMATFGWTYQKGLVNFYLSLGLAFAELAFFWSQKGWRRIVPIILSPIIAAAHPFGFAWFACAAAYIKIGEIVPRRFYYLIVTASAGILAIVRWSLLRHYRVEAPAHSVLFLNGFDQVVLTKWYTVPMAGLILLFVTSVGQDVRGSTGESNHLDGRLILLQLYLIVEACIFLMPDAIYLPQFAGPISRVAERTTTISAVLLCGLIVGERERRWQFPALLGVSIVFFALLYNDTAKQSRMEQEMERLTRTVAAGERVLVTIRQPREYRFSTEHLLDEACIGHCFAYGNYEPASTQFRVRALHGNRIVSSDVEQVAAMERGEYVVQPEDLPAYKIYQCGPTWMALCIHPLQAGERNDGLGNPLWPHR